MFPLDYALAVVLLTAPVDATERPEAGRDYAYLQTTLQTIAVQWEILDPREARYFLTRSEDFASDLNTLRRRHADLADAPPVFDCIRFPDREVVNDMLAFNRAFRERLEARLSVESFGQSELREALNEAEQLYRIWDQVRDSRCDYYYVTVRRQALKTVKEMVGNAAYYNGTMPPHVPVWRFAQADRQ
jgi:hypothetical protein